MANGSSTKDYLVSDTQKRKLLLLLQIISGIVVLSIPPAGWVIKLYLDNQFADQREEFMDIMNDRFLTFNDGKSFVQHPEFTTFKTKTNGVLQAFQASEYVTQPLYDVNRLSDKMEISALKEDLDELKDQGREQNQKLDKLLEMVLTRD